MAVAVEWGASGRGWTAGITCVAAHGCGNDFAASSTTRSLGALPRQLPRCFVRSGPAERTKATPRTAERSTLAPMGEWPESATLGLLSVVAHGCLDVNSSRHLNWPLLASHVSREAAAAQICLSSSEQDTSSS